MARDTRMELGECVGSVLGHLGLECAVLGPLYC